MNKPLAAFPPSVRLKEHQTKHTTLIPIERLQYKKSLGRIFGAATPPGALVKILPRISVPGISMSVRPCVRVSVLVANGSLDLAARATVLQVFLFD